MVRWSETLGAAERWLLPSACIACRGPVDARRDSLICEICRARWRTLSHPTCTTCGDHLPLQLACRACVTWPPELGPVRSAVRLDERVRPLVHRFKYEGWQRLAEVFALRMLPLLTDAPDADLVPIPLAEGRRRARGYNQAEVLASALGALTGRPVRPDRLVRIRETATQTRLTPEHRRANLAEAFGGGVCHRAVILVDDVYTTGATLRSAAETLIDRGAPVVRGVTFARAELPLARPARGTFASWLRRTNIQGSL